LNLFSSGKRRRYSGKEIVDLVRREYGIQLTEGLSRLKAYNQAEIETAPRYSFTQLNAAYKISAGTEPYLAWETAQIPGSLKADHVVFAWVMSFGNGSPFPQPSSKFDLYLDGRYLLSFTVVRENRRWVKADCTLAYFQKYIKTAPYGGSFSLDSQIRDESAVSMGIALLKVPGSMLRPGRNCGIMIRPSSRQISANWVRVGKAQSEPFRNINMFAAIDYLETGGDYSIDDYRIFYGDIHSHSGESAEGRSTCGTGKWSEQIEYAKDVSCLDFLSITDHDWQLSPEDWDNLKKLNNESMAGGQFVTIHGYEWSSRSYGHRNVYYLDDNMPLIPSYGDAVHRPGFPDSGEKQQAVFESDTQPSPLILWKKLDALKADAITIPHHPSTMQIPLNINDFYNPKYDRLIEIYSCWGNSLEPEDPVTLNNDRVNELAYINFMEAQYKLGFTASSDSHDGCPGNAQWCYKQRYLGHYLGSGRACVLAGRLSREDVYHALKARRCYATTGAKIVLDFRIEGTVMGSVLDRNHSGGKLNLSAKVRGTDRIDNILLFENGMVKEKIECRNKEEKINLSVSPGQEPKNYFIKIIQADGEMAWSSPIWVE